MKLTKRPLFIFEIANNHQGSVAHGLKIIRELKKVSSMYEEYFDFAVKFQYRNLDTFIRKDYQDREDIKNIKRFKDTRLNEEQFSILVQEARNNGFLAICTPFDEDSVDLIMKHQYDIIKIASCSFTDWPLLEKIAETGKTVIASCAAASLEQIDKVVHFFSHRGIDLGLMHCVAEYPTDCEHLEMNQIDLLCKRYPDICIGFSTHEDPEDDRPVRIAVAKSAMIFEKHVGVETEAIKLNGYSATPEQVSRWLKAAFETFQMCGGTDLERYIPTAKELNDLRLLQRGAFSRKKLLEGEKLDFKNTYFAFPCEENQVLASHFSKYNAIALKRSSESDESILLNNVAMEDTLDTVRELLQKVLCMIKQSKIVLPLNAECNLSHHYGLDKFEEIGCGMIDCINREYCKKILVVLPGQKHPAHVHYKKEETFSMVYGELTICVGKEIKHVRPGEFVVIERGVEHSFSSETGCVFEEISTTHYTDDSYYADQENFVNPRKTAVYVTQDMLDSIKFTYEI